MPDQYDDLLDSMSSPATPSYSTPARTPKGALRYVPQGAQNWSINDAGKIKDFYRQTFNQDLPIASFGQGNIHNRWGYDHRNAFDVSLAPSTSQGQALIKYLQSNNVPFQAFDRAIPGAATAAHIHVGMPSHHTTQTYAVGTTLGQQGGTSQPTGDEYDQLLDGLSNQSATSTVTQSSGSIPIVGSLLNSTPRTLAGATVKKLRPRQNAQSPFLAQATDLSKQAQNLLSQNQSAPFNVPGVRTAQAGRRPQASIADVRRADDAALAQSGMNSVGPISSEQFVANKQANDEQNRVSSDYDNQIRSLIEANVRASIVNGGTVPYDTIAAPVEQQLKIYKEAVAKHPELRGHDPQTVANEVNRLGDLQSDPETIRNVRKSGQDIGLPLLQGFKSSVGSTVRALGNLADVVNVGPQSTKSQSLTDTANYLKEQGRGIEEAQQVSDLIDEPQNGQERFQRSLLRGVGATPGMIAKFEAFGIPTMIAEGGLSRADEGIGGVLKGAAESAISLYGMQATGKVLSPLVNAFTWTAIPTAKGVLIDHKDLSDALGESIPGGVLAGVSAEGIENNLRSKGFEPFNLKAEDGRTATVYVDGEGNFYSARTRAAKSDRPDINANDATFDSITKGARLGQWTKGRVNADNLFDVRNRTSGEAPTAEPEGLGATPTEQPRIGTSPRQIEGQAPSEPTTLPAVGPGYAMPADSAELTSTRQPVNDYRIEEQGGKVYVVTPQNIPDVKTYPASQRGRAAAIDRLRTLSEQAQPKLTASIGAQLASKGINAPAQVAPESVSPVDATANMPEQSEGEQPHYSNSQNRRVRNVATGNRGQFKKGFRDANEGSAERVEGVSESSVLPISQGAGVFPATRDVQNAEASAPSVGQTRQTAKATERQLPAPELGAGVSPSEGAKPDWQVTREEYEKRGLAEKYGTDYQGYVDRMEEEGNEVLPFGKEPYEMSRDEFDRYQRANYFSDVGKRSGAEILGQFDKHGMLDGERRWTIEQAIKNGKTVPHEVLADYPDLAQKYQGQEKQVQEASVIPLAAKEKRIASTSSDKISLMPNDSPVVSGKEAEGQGTPNRPKDIDSHIRSRLSLGKGDDFYVRMAVNDPMGERSIIGRGEPAHRIEAEVEQMRKGDKFFDEYGQEITPDEALERVQKIVDMYDDGYSDVDNNAIRDYVLGKRDPLPYDVIHYQGVSTFKVGSIDEWKREYVPRLRDMGWDVDDPDFKVYALTGEELPTYIGEGGEAVVRPAKAVDISDLVRDSKSSNAPSLRAQPASVEQPTQVEVGAHGRFTHLLHKSYPHPETGKPLPAFLTEPSVRKSVGLPEVSSDEAKSSAETQRVRDAIAKRMRAPRSSYLGVNGFQRFIDIHKNSLSSDAIDAYHATVLEHENYSQKLDGFLTHPIVDRILSEAQDGQIQRGAKTQLAQIAKQFRVSKASADAALDRASQRRLEASDVGRGSAEPKESTPPIESQNSRTESSLRRPTGATPESSTGESASGNQNQNNSIEQKKSALLGLLRARDITRAEYTKRLSDIESGKDINVVTGSQSKISRFGAKLKNFLENEQGSASLTRGDRSINIITGRPGMRVPTAEERKALKIPPAWTDVKIDDSPDARLIAIGKDTKGRTQRIYSAAHSDAALVAKFIRQREFNTSLPRLMERIHQDLNSRNREEASVLRLIAMSGFRVGGEGDTGAKIKAYGASTLRTEHVKIERDTVHFDFIGKLGVRQQHSIKDAGLAEDLQERLRRGGAVFQTNDIKVRNYLHSISEGKAYKVHDFRTWNATEAARRAVENIEVPTTPEEYWAKRDEVGDIAAAKIGDTRVIALESYVDPLVFEDWRERAGVEEDATRPKQTRRKARDVSRTNETNGRTLRDQPLRQRGSGEELSSQREQVASRQLPHSSRQSEAGFINLPSLKNLKNTAVSLANLPRAVMTSFDLSAPLRQGAIFTLTEPKLAVKAFADMIRGISSKRYATFKQQLDLHPMIELAEESGLHLTSLAGDKLEQKEEVYMSNLAEKIPGVKQSEQAYVSYLDSIRMGAFEKYAKEMGSAGITSPESYKAIARFINAATGRGDLGKTLNNAAPILNSIFFSPRYLASRIQLMNPVEYMKMPAAARKIAMRKMFEFAALIGLTLFLLKQSGADVNLTNPDSPDWLKVKLGNTRYDFLAGFQQPARFAYRLAESFNRRRKGERLSESEQPSSIIGKFLRSKENPGFSLLHDYVSGKDFNGELFRLLPGKDKQGEMKAGAIGSRLIPIIVQDAYEGYKDAGGTGIARTLPATMLGVGVQTYSPNNRSTIRPSGAAPKPPSAPRPIRRTIN